jgi:GT2 family glycosyltransferase
MTPQQVAILVLNHNGKVHLDRCLRSVLAQAEPNDHVYLVDNGSVDGSVDYVKRHYPAVKLIRFNRNLGFASAYNHAVASITEQLVVFLNNDVEVDESWLVELKSAAEKSPGDLAACGSKILFYDNRSVVNHAGGMLVPIGGGIDVGFMEIDKEQSGRQCSVGCVSGASMMAPRSVFMKLGGFDPDFFAYFEDVDYCWRAWLSGYRVIHVPTSRVYHKLSATMGPILKPERIFLGERNRLQSMLKNLNLGNVMVGLIASLFYDLARIVTFLESDRAHVVTAVLRANWWTVRHLSRIVVKRRDVQTRRRISDSFLVRHGLMVSFTDGIKEFQRLTALRMG